MSEIEKLYENAGVEPTIIDACTVEDKYWQNEELANKYGTFDMYMNAKCGQQEDCTTLCSCAYTKEAYPPFTAEKQIAILMFIVNKFGDIGFQKMYSIRGNDENTRKDFIKCLCDCEHETLDSRPVDFYYQNDASGDNFEESLAGLINNLWQDLTEEECKQLKDILQ